MKIIQQKLEVDFQGVTLAFNAKTKLKVDQLIRMAEKAGANILKKPEEIFWGGFPDIFKI